MKSTKNSRYRVSAAFVAAITAAVAIPAWGDDATDSSSSVHFSSSSAALFGQALSEEQLAGERGGDKYVQISENLPIGTVHDNVAEKVITGSNIITEGSFTNVYGIPTSIQNTGNNVLIQNSMNVNLTLH